ncbi:hypothetical protein HYT53_01250 [Candidatus Woesearchaeota archaeon]|nr:hypothetical protein [Candidatus Woesearchaeota archaeon]
MGYSMAEEGGLEKKLKGYNESVAIGQGVGLAATAAGVYGGFSYPEIISNYVPFGRNLVSSNLGLFGLGIASNFIGDQLGFAASLYSFNKEKYKGLKGKISFVKDGFNLGVRHLGSYLITYPLAGAVTALALGTGLLTGPLAFILPYAVESLITGFGYIASTLGYRRKMAQPSYAT